jgi:tryptophan 7-halogenase
MHNANAVIEQKLDCVILSKLEAVMSKQADGMDILIVGGGTAGWMAAALLAPYAQNGYRVRLIESEDIGTVGVGEATIPQILLYNQALGINEEEFLRETQGTIKLGIEFADWHRIGSSYMHSFGAVGRDIGIIPFQHYWRRAQSMGKAGPLSDYALNEVAARAGKMQHGKPRTWDALPDMPYAYHFDAGLFAAYLRKLAEARGVERIEGKVTATTLRSEDGFVDTVKLEDGREFTADLFIDCSGFRGLLIEGALSTGYDDWTNWLPCNRAVAVPCGHGDNPQIPYTRATARTAGWQWRIPLQHRIGNGYVYCADYLSADEAEQTLLNNLDGPALGDPRHLQFTTGKRRKFWNKNVLALGLAGGFMEPLESTSIHLIQSGLSRLLKMLPGKNWDPVIADEYNRQCDFEFISTRDFLILHYKATVRDDSDFWRDRAAMAVPDSLAAKIDLFASNGHIFREHEELFTEVGWLQVMVGQGITPSRWHPLADAVEVSDLGDFMETLQLLIAREVNQMPDYKTFLQQPSRLSKGH